MKKLILLAIIGFSFSSCATIFTSSKQTITFSGIEGTRIYDANNNIKLAEIGNDRIATISIKKKRSDKQLLAKKEGYKTLPFILESTFNTTSLWNILFWPGFIVDLGTEQMYKWDNTMINVDLEKKNTEAK